jgi:hypothetical protein
MMLDSPGQPSSHPLHRYGASKERSGFKKRARSTSLQGGYTVVYLPGERTQKRT